MLVGFDPEDKLFVPHRVEGLQKGKNSRLFPDEPEESFITDLFLRLGDHRVDVDVADDRVHVHLHVRVAVAEDVLLGKRVRGRHLDPDQRRFFVILQKFAHAGRKVALVIVGLGKLRLDK